MSVRMTEITFEIALESGDGDGGEGGMRLIREAHVCPSVCFENSEHTTPKPIFPGCFVFSRHFRCFSRRFRYLERRVMHLFTIKFW